MKKLYFILLILCFKANAQVPVELAKLKNFDLCYPDKFINYNGVTYFTIDDGIHGNELWRSDGTEAGTYLFKEFTPGESGSYIPEFIIFNSELYFSANAGLWKTNGTQNGTVLIKQFSDFSFKKLTHCGLYLVFSSSNDANGNELWKSDGTFGGTTLIADLSPGTASSQINEIVYAPGFFANDIYVTLRKEGETFQNLYKMSYSTALGGAISTPSLVPDSDYAERLVYYSGSLYFFKGINHNIFQKYNGSSVSSIKNFDPFSVPSQNKIMIFNGNMYFIAKVAATGQELWKSNGTPTGTILVKDINVGTSDSQINELFVYNSRLIFRANDGISGFELWQSDGTNAGTNLIYDVIPGSSGSNIFIIGSSGDKLSFFSSISENDSKLFQYNFTSSQLTLLKDFSWYSPNIEDDPYKGIYLNNTIICTGHDNVYGTQLWKSDGTSSGTTLLKRINKGNANLSNFTSLGNKTFFTAKDKDFWSVPFITDGTQAGSFQLANLHIYNYGENKFGEMLNNELIFSAQNIDTYEHELWKTNGTAASTVLLKNIRTTPASDAPSSPKNLYKYNNEIYFEANDGINGNELWKTDGTTAGTVLVKDLSPGSNSTNFLKFVAHNGYLYFIATLNTGIWRLWRTDGTAAGTIVLASLFGNNSNGNIHSLVAFNNKLYFVDDENLYGPELWVYDIATGNKSLVKDIKSGSLGSSPEELTLGNNMLFFTADDGLTGRELYVTDGTSAGTQLINIYPETSTNNPKSSDPQRLTWLGDKLLFTAIYNSNPYIGRELWKSNGSFLGTTLVKDINTPNFKSSFTTLSSNIKKTKEFTKIGNTIFFVADNGSIGHELWRSDGTEAGTNLVADNFEGYGNDGVLKNAEIFVNETTVFYEATDGSNGRELWTFQICPITLNINTVVPSPTQTQHASQYLTSTSNLANINLSLGNRTIKYKAGKSITLEPGFYAKGIQFDTPNFYNPQTVFTAEINGCGN